MFNKLNGNKKKIMVAAVSLVLVAALIAGIAYGVRVTTASTVPVVAVSDLNYGSYLDWQNSVTGMITTEAEQNVYLSDTEKVEEVVVQEGQPVHKGDVLLRYDTRTTKLNLEKEELNRQKIELAITVAKENIKILENTSPASDGGDFGFVGDFIEIDEAEILSKAEVHEHILKADAKPVSDDPEDITLGTEYAPYVFLCKGDSVVITKDFIKKWQKEAAKKKFKQLYIELAVRDKAQNLQKAWITDIMLLSELYDIEVDLTTGKTAYAAMNKPEELAALLRKILLDVPEDERGAWLAAMMDKLMITTEKEDKLEERGELLAQMLNELSALDKEEFAAAAALMDSNALSVMFESLSENLTQEQIEQVDQEALAGMLTMLLDNMTEAQIKEIDAEVLASFLEKLSAEQIGALDAEVISSILSALSTKQIQGLDSEFLVRLFTEMTQEQISGVDAENMKQFFDRLTSEQLEALIEVRGEEIEEILARQKEEAEKEKKQQEKAQQDDQDDQQDDQKDQQDDQDDHQQDDQKDQQDEPVAGNNEDQQDEPVAGNNEDQQDEPVAGNNEDQQDETVAENNEDQQDPAPEENSGTSSSGEGVPATAPSPASGTGTGSGSQILSSDISYTSDELAKARREAKEKLRDLELDLKESAIKIEKAQKALDKGVVTANMNGVIKTAGDPDSPPTDGSAFITVSGTEGLYVRSGVKESKLGTIHEGDRVTVTSWQTGGQYEAEIKSISPYPDTTGMFDNSNSETYYPFIAVVEDRDAVMQNGEWVEVSYAASDSGNSGNTLTVMKAFVREEGSKKYVYVRDEDKKLKKQYIITGTLSDSGYEILDGLSESDWIAFPYGKNVKEGAKTREASYNELYE